jgi:hypothetical protein
LDDKEENYGRVDNHLDDEEENYGFTDDDSENEEDNTVLIRGLLGGRGID